VATDARIAIAFTAARELDAKAQDGVVLNVLVTAVPFVDRYVTGACTGGDAFIGRWLHENRPDAEHVIIVPADRSRVDEWWLEVDGTNVTVIPMPQGTTYADRNARLVTEGTAVFGFPAYPEDDPRSRRSGTWQTIRLSRRAGKLSQWHCVTPPYRGRIERYPEFILAAAGFPVPGLHAVYCRTCRHAWYDGDICGCACTDDTRPGYEDWAVDPDPASIPPEAWGERMPG